MIMVAVFPSSLPVWGSPPRLLGLRAILSDVCPSRFHTTTLWVYHTLFYEGGTQAML